MFKKLSIATAAIAMGATSLIAPTVASAAPTAITATSFDAGVTEYQRYRDRDRRYYGNRNNNRRTPQRCSSTEGTVIGAVAGGLLGNTVAGNGNRLLGTVIGGGAGALAGREIDRSGQPRRCARNR
ncbi:glycine zipper 2TM domain-containing protein [Sphingomonas qomolangmaensis]|uniref:17 kDa surface antigen n=1 Tax=Sphingomonas qomolangmaensis TaxID=2918765 RepID=A0ABY5L3N6_9SPHN|nr:glycine zipper 2TM domain-containing protein [Sphingomonas qomolangmaensis]UUL81564.1 glycine zipper 2TM domain-containing protein [Sphingomonas qomolangmaensis]